MKTVADLDRDALERFAVGFGFELRVVADDVAIPGSYWGAPEAGLEGNAVIVQHATPIHSLLHETSHWLMCTPERRAQLFVDAGGTDAEEEAVCALQLELAGRLPAYSGDECLADMDAWGYSFRQGHAAAWLREDGPLARRRWPAHVHAALNGRGSVPARR
ncbi:MAG: hypothetical protein AAFZ58_01710 [Pseudomonadota bacterium]